MKNEKGGSYEENVALVRLAQRGDPEAKERIFLKNQPLIYHLASRFAERGVDIHELVDVGTLGLVKAMNTFDTERGVMFSTYAVPLIFGEMRRFLRDDGIIKVSREEKRLGARLLAERDRRHSTGEPTTIHALAEAVGVSAEDAASAIFSSSPVRSLEECAYDDDSDVTLLSTITDEEEEERSFRHLALKLAMEKLSEGERRLILLRYFRDYSQAKCAEILGVTQVKVSREEKKILKRLKTLLS